MQNYSQPPHLTISTSLSESSGYTTPTSSLSNDETLEKFFTRAGYSPPAKADTIPMTDVRGVVNKLKANWWDSLNLLQQIKLSFLVLRHQHEYIMRKLQQQQVPEPVFTRRVLKALEDALDEGTQSGKRLTAFVRRGGDRTLEMSGLAEKGVHPDLLGGFLKQFQFEEWNDHQHAPTIFNHPEKAVNAFVRFQEDSSSVCYMVVVANAVFYSMARVSITAHSVNVAEYGLNISRFMRNRFTHEEIFANIFAGDGGHPEQMLRRLLAPANPEKNTVRDFDLYDDVTTTFETIKHTLKHYGPLIVENFKVFPELVERNGIVKFGGDYASKKKYDDGRNVNHAILVVGARLTWTEEMGNMELMLQNSWEHKPFLIVGYKLLHSMGVSRLLYLAKDLSFQARPFDLDGSTHVTQSGSPTHRDLDTFDDSKTPEDCLWSPDKKLPVPKEDSEATPAMLDFLEPIDRKKKYYSSC